MILIVTAAIISFCTGAMVCASAIMGSRSGLWPQAILLSVVAVFMVASTIVAVR